MYAPDRRAPTLTGLSGRAAVTTQRSHGRAGPNLCHDSYCTRYRNAARSSNTQDSSMGNAEFRRVNR